MKVKELIAELQKYDPETEVELSTEGVGESASYIEYDESEKILTICS